MRLIDADEFEDALENTEYDISPAYEPDGYSHKLICEVLEETPTVDAVPVVRCRDCKHLHMWDQKDRYAFCPKTNIVFSPFEKDIRTFFCSYGERRSGNEK